MRTLVIALASLALAGCGGLDESNLPDVSGTSAPALEGQESTLDTHAEKMPEQDLVWAVVWSAEVNEFTLVQVPVEERFFYPVDVNVPPPELPPAPCPNCR
ncbi:MAG: hypothetical protein Q8L48_10610 [Archangium sp.]|nr:hypothetical protein [Archangium sp.]